MPWIGFVFVMGHMSVNHVLRQMADAPDVVDVTGTCQEAKRSRLGANWHFTGAQMVLVMKVEPSVIKCCI